MGWENKIVGYKIKKFDSDDIIPVDAIFMMRESGKHYLCGSYYHYEYFLFRVPLYKKIRTKKMK